MSTFLDILKDGYISISGPVDLTNQSDMYSQQEDYNTNLNILKQLSDALRGRFEDERDQAVMLFQNGESYERLSAQELALVFLSTAINQIRGPYHWVQYLMDSIMTKNEERRWGGNAA